MAIFQAANRLQRGGGSVIVNADGTISVVGDMTLTGAVIPGAIDGAATAGAIEWDGSNFRGYDGAQWLPLDVQATSAGGFTDDGTVVRLTLATDDVHLGAATAPGAKLKVTGNVIVTGGVTFTGGVINLGATPAATGQLRLDNAGWIKSRNAANSADLNIIRANASDVIEIGAALEVLSTLAVTGNLTVSGTGPHAVGGAVVGHAAFRHTGSFTSDGSSTVAVGLDYIGTLTGAVGDTGWLTGVRFQGTIVTQGTDTNIGVVSQLRIEEPDITNNLASSGKPDVAASLYIVNAPTEGDVNAALYVAAGGMHIIGAGPHVIGGTAVDYNRLTLGNNFTSGGASNRAALLTLGNQLTGAVGDTVQLVGALFAGTIVTQGTDTNIGVIAQVQIDEPTITNNLASAGKPDVAAALYISGAPDEGDVNAALYVAAGNTNLGGDLVFSAASANLVIGTAALATNATDGFIYISTSAGTPTGAPTTFTGRAPIHYDTTNDILFIYDGGWNGITGGGGSGDITRVDITGGIGLLGDLNTLSGDHVQTLDFDATSLTALASGLVAGDHIVVSDGTVSKKAIVSGIPLSIFDNDLTTTVEVSITVFGPTDDVTTGNGKAYISIPSAPDGFNLTAVHAEVITAGTTGTTDIQIHNIDGPTADMLSTVLTIDSTETGSNTAATPAVINAAEDDVAEFDVLRIDVDAVSTTAPKGLIVRLTFSNP